jgi:death-on-curing protein
MLESALMRPQNLWTYSTAPPSLEMLAASYAFGISSNHPFIDGNKRTAFLTAYVFLRKNGLSFTASEPEVVETFLALAAGKLSEDQLGDWIQVHTGSA